MSRSGSIIPQGYRKSPVVKIVSSITKRPLIWRNLMVNKNFTVILLVIVKIGGKMKPAIFTSITREYKMKLIQFEFRAEF